MASLSSLKLSSQRNKGGASGLAGLKKAGTTSAKGGGNNTGSLGASAALRRGTNTMSSVASSNMARGAYGPTGA